MGIRVTEVGYVSWTGSLTYADAVEACVEKIKKEHPDDWALHVEECRHRLVLEQNGRATASATKNPEKETCQAVIVSGHWSFRFWFERPGTSLDKWHNAG